MGHQTGVTGILFPLPPPLPRERPNATGLESSLSSSVDPPLPSFVLNMPLPLLIPLFVYNRLLLFFLILSSSSFSFCSVRFASPCPVSFTLSPSFQPSNIPARSHHLQAQSFSSLVPVFSSTSTFSPTTATYSPVSPDYPTERSIHQPHGGCRTNPLRPPMMLQTK